MCPTKAAHLVPSGSHSRANKPSHIPVGGKMTFDGPDSTMLINLSFCVGNPRPKKQPVSCSDGSSGKHCSLLATVIAENVSALGPPTARTWSNAGASLGPKSFAQSVIPLHNQKKKKIWVCVCVGGGGIHFMYVLCLYVSVLNSTAICLHISVLNSLPEKHTRVHRFATIVCVRVSCNQTQHVLHPCTTQFRNIGMCEWRFHNNTVCSGYCMLCIALCNSA